MKFNNGDLVRLRGRSWIGVYEHPHVLWMSGTYKGKRTIEYEDKLIRSDFELTSFMGYESLKFTVTCTMKTRWVPQFLSMLTYMEQLGGLGSSRLVSFYADGDGDFRPSFEFDKALLPCRAEPTKNDDGNKTYDAG